ncbi:hypothetical protein [Edaphobacter sp. DSM 109919]|uniref:Uncharacterized protein n=1 Tax=Edaphobacter paludis TaxID=3035702 RepID=A0AAU7CYV9_9BACT
MTKKVKVPTIKKTAIGRSIAANLKLSQQRIIKATQQDAGGSGVISR